MLRNKISINNKKKQIVKWGVILVVLLGVIFIISAVRSYFNGRNSADANSNSTETQSGDNQNILAEIDLDGTYSFVGRDKAGNDAGDLVFRIPKIELTKEVLVQGRPANAKGGKAFLVLNIEIDNADVEKRYIAPVDVIRLLEENGKKFAPDIHSNVVEIQPISTKITRVGFVVPEDKRDFHLQIGELDGDKQSLDITLK